MSSPIFQDFFITENYLVLSRIFLKLDAFSLRESKLVHSSWYRFITEYLFKSPSCRAELRRILTRQWIEAEPEVTAFSTTKPLFHIDADDSEIFCGLETGEIEIRDGCTLDLKTTLNAQKCSTVVTINKDYIVAGFFIKKLTVWDRKSHNIIDQIETDSNIYNMKICTNGIIVVSTVNGDLKSYEICSHGKLVTKRLFPGSTRNINNFDCDNERILAATGNGTINVWKQNDGSNVFKTEIGPRTTHVHLSGSLGVTVSKVESDSMIRIWGGLDSDVVIPLRELRTERIWQSSVLDEQLTTLSLRGMSVYYPLHNGSIYESKFRFFRDKRRGFKVLKDRLLVQSDDKIVLCFNFWKGRIPQGSSNQDSDGKDFRNFKFVKKLYIC